MLRMYKNPWILSKILPGSIYKNLFRFAYHVTNFYPCPEQSQMANWYLEICVSLGSLTSVHWVSALQYLFSHNQSRHSWWIDFTLRFNLFQNYLFSFFNYLLGLLFLVHLNYNNYNFEMPLLYSKNVMYMYRPINK